MPPYTGLLLVDVLLVKTPEQALAARDALLACDAIGFDTESKPTFTKGEVSTGPHLIQFATDAKAYLFQVGSHTDDATLAVLQAILEPAAPLKVGFGLSDDVKRLHAKLAIRAGGVVDLSVALRTPGQRNDLGAKTAVAKFFGLKLQKSKKSPRPTGPCRASPAANCCTRPTMPRWRCACIASGSLPAASSSP